jgi:hypothetical protein
VRLEPGAQANKKMTSEERTSLLKFARLSNLVIRISSSDRLWLKTVLGGVKMVPNA